MIRNSFDLWEYERVDMIDRCSIFKMFMKLPFKWVGWFFSRKFIWIPIVLFLAVYSSFCAIYFGLINNLLVDGTDKKIVFEQFYNNYSCISFLFPSKTIIEIMVSLGSAFILLCAIIIIACIVVFPVFFLLTRIKKMMIKKENGAERELFLVMFWGWLREKTCVKYKIMDLEE